MRDLFIMGCITWYIRPALALLVHYRYSGKLFNNSVSETLSRTS